ncbi:(d)CMP kinase [Halobacteriaceae archaeon GCM10025711]
MLLTVSGPPGSGTSTVASALADQLGYEHVSGGDIFRELAAERDLSLAEFNELAERDDQIDRDLDRRLRETAKTRDDVVLESRLAGWLAGDHADIRIWLGAPLDARAERIADREDVSPEAAREQTGTRERSEKRRYREYYDIPFDDLSIYDLSLNTARWDADAVLAIVTEAVDRYTPAGDEGAMPVEGVRYEF